MGLNVQTMGPKHKWPVSYGTKSVNFSNKCPGQYFVIRTMRFFIFYHLNTLNSPNFIFFILYHSKVIAGRIFCWNSIMCITRAYFKGFLINFNHFFRHLTYIYYGQNSHSRCLKLTKKTLKFGTCDAHTWPNLKIFHQRWPQMIKFKKHIVWRVTYKKIKCKNHIVWMTKCYYPIFKIIFKSFWTCFLNFFRSSLIFFKSNFRSLFWSFFGSHFLSSNQI